MKIILVVPTFPKLSETFIVSKFQGLIERGYDVEVVCKNSSEDDWNHFEFLRSHPELRRRVHVQWPVRPRFILPALILARLIRCLARSPAGTADYLWRGIKRLNPLDLAQSFYLDADLIAARPDLIHFEFGSLAVGRMYLGDLLRCKVVVSFRGYDLNFAGVDAPDYYNEVWSKATALHLLGNALWQRAQQRGCPPEKLHALIPPAIDLDFFQSRGRAIDPAVGTPERPLRLVSVGRLEWKKGYEYALDAVARLCAADVSVEYRIVGDGEYLEALTFCRKQLNLEDTVEFLGALGREGVREQLEWADVFVHASVTEGFCNAVIEAQAMELLVVTSDADGLTENVDDTITGFIVPRRDPASMASQLLAVSRQPELRRSMGQAGTARARALFALPEQLDKFEAMYQQAVRL